MTTYGSVGDRGHTIVDTWVNQWQATLSRATCEWCQYEGVSGEINRDIKHISSVAAFHKSLMDTHNVKRPIHHAFPLNTMYTYDVIVYLCLHQF